ncbi:hypothetical protein RhiJN_27333 [Ceratobasidium sp. AG-Ba]|nr:hypothetical protein RhiJN_13244 [Ceratobasidium sp. AG-Ba]QRV99314.1 hypothetical protein RhiJN_27333 [Ceratobasidium sp. AG-Ba]QRW13815.1 hypothetical protein RhiLY_12814 [Ceratobasidium sp. AG-Ba]
MQRPTHKRKSNSSGLSGSLKPKKKKSEAALSPDARILARILKKTESTVIQNTLLSSISTASPAHLDALKQLLGPLVTSALNPLHCVRCHKSYFENENNYTSCVIPHYDSEYAANFNSSSDDYDEHSSDDYNWGHPDGERMKFVCCGETFREKEGEEAQLPCIREKHTTDPKQVDYYVDPFAREQSDRKFRKYEALNPNVVTCEEEGCLSKAGSSR